MYLPCIPWSNEKLGGGYSVWSFVKKDLYLVITQKLILLKSMKSAGFYIKSGRFHVKST